MIAVIVLSVPAFIITMSFLYGLTTLYSLLRNLKDRVWISNLVNQFKYCTENLPRVAILIPLYKEDRYSIEETFISIAKQIYPQDRISVFIILENGDETTKSYVEELKYILINAKIHVDIHVNTGKRAGKAVAINSILREVVNGYDMVMVLDAGDRILDQYYLVKCADMVKKGYSIIGTKVYRVGKNLIAKFSYIDAVLWYNVSFPAIHSITKVPFISGEGMVLSSQFIKRIGGFPEVLAEDSYTAMLGFIYGERIGFVDSIILEGAPSTFSSLFKQRLRWYRGGMECFIDFITKYSKNVELGTVVKASFAYLQPVALTAPFISLLILTLSLFMNIPSSLVLLAKIEVISLILSPITLYFISDIEIKDLSLLLVPVNWFLQSFIAFIALLPIKVGWLRTSNRSYADMLSTSITRTVPRYALQQ
ncbi:MAG: glycosyltransferase family 2 protein [Desulfurococcaceae archaeon]|nr:glycosyltransferase family 2 protein [Desulfurococcaceae archaeon]